MRAIGFLNAYNAANVSPVQQAQLRYRIAKLCFDGSWRITKNLTVYKIEN